LGMRQIFQRTRRWLVSLRPYPSLALFAVPVILLEPVKPVAGYFVATGHLVAGAITFVTGELLKLTCVERLFELNRKKLLSIPAFAFGYRHWRRMMDVIESLEIWKASRRLAKRRSEEHTSELQSHLNLVCRLLLEKKNDTDKSCRYYQLHYIL